MRDDGRPSSTDATLIEYIVIPVDTGNCNGIESTYLCCCVHMIYSKTNLLV